MPPIETGHRTIISGAKSFQHAIFSVIDGRPAARFFYLPRSVPLQDLRQELHKTCGNKVLRLLYNCGHEFPNITLHCPLPYEAHY